MEADTFPSSDFVLQSSSSHSTSWTICSKILSPNRALLIVTQSGAMVWNRCIYRSSLSCAVNCCQMLQAVLVVREVGKFLLKGAKRTFVLFKFSIRSRMKFHLFEFQWAILLLILVGGAKVVFLTNRMSFPLTEKMLLIMSSSRLSYVFKDLQIVHFIIDFCQLLASLWI